MTIFQDKVRKATHCSWLIVTFFCIGLSGISSTAYAQLTTTPSQSTSFSEPMARDVLFSALGFLKPRTLEPHSIREFCLWGLDGLTAIDPSIIVSEKPGNNSPDHPLPETLIITQNQNILFQHPIPHSEDKKSWAELIAHAMKLAWEHSSTIRDAGNDALLQGFFDELFNHLDPYSRYLGPETASTDRMKRTGNKGNIGITLEKKNRSVFISAINTNGPAWEAGLDLNQKVIAINGQATRNKPLDVLQNLLDGDDQTDVSITVSVAPHREQTFKLTRSQVPPETVFFSTLGPFSILTIHSFSTQTAEEISQYLDQIINTPSSHKNSPAPGIILDLRGDRGGVLQQAVTAAALFLDHGIAVTTHGRDPQANHVWAVQGGDMTNGTPIVILVDGRTASAAEILAAALADHRRAVIVGSETFGKGLVQIIGQMPNGGELFVTWSRNQAPLGWPIQSLGVMPQICTSNGTDNLKKQLHSLLSGINLQQDAILLARNSRYPAPVDKILAIRRHCPAALGSDLDIDAAKFLLSSKIAYNAALNTIPD
ncbi:S41 family peptidase [Swingsia samuiensis]|uniref:PDZ domain-containing protein n=1 Tax=Swingsia samuiensis TaxID=1293412 RepID=A0A4Y6UGP6_9PROT|nr:S41 family peptidase [Swingsia samuiensis]QDH16739.1 PDZ domain-containing protein [Swingsia samuiensis]